MEELINGLMTKVGLDKATAEKVISFLKENATKVPGWLASSDMGKQVLDKLPGGLGGMFGGNK